MNKIQFDKWTFTDDQIIQGECYLSRSLLSSSLEINTLDADVYNTDHSIKNFVVDTPVAYLKDDKRVASFYVQDIERISRNQYSIHAVSFAGVLDNQTHYGGIYTGQTVGEVVPQICGSIPVYVANNVASIKLYGWLPIASRRENLAQVLFAISATVATDDTGAVWIQGLEPEEKREVTEDETEESASIEYTSPAVDVIVLEHQYTEGQEEITLFEGATSAGDIITFSEPCHSLVASGFTITEQGANYAIVSSGSGKLTGKKYVHSTREVKGKRTQARDAGENESKIRVEEATLVSLVNSRAVADRLADYYACAERIVADVAYQADDAGDVLSQYHPYDGDMVQTCIESLDITLSGKLLAKMTSLVGYIPPDISQIEYYDTFEILTGTGTWTAPKGAKNARAVLIGGGDGGTNGKDGTGGTDGHVTGNPSAEGKGGKGGEPGTPGNGGKILQIEIDATQSYAYKSGVGGAVGELGTATTFGVFSSANGTANDNGYTDIINKKTYARKGFPGVAGGDGGDAENNGEDVETWKGGQGGEKDTLNGYSANGGGGSGAAKGSNGNDGTDGYMDRWSTGNPDNPYGYLARGGRGGKGADAVSPDFYPEYGSGGSAGHGGGGGGGGGTANGSSDTSSNDGRGGDGGAGSTGTPGKPGCIIVYYSLPRKETA
ncbi:hypothetical protein [uncultured Agathobaculum sp.]|uniref:hypothetical protein n=1 Tax=uncultured Agathobaculum sp. TaxID=2048140 RepID=UPI00320AE783